MLTLNYYKKPEISEKDVAALLPVSRINQFEMASMFSSKKTSIFYESLMKSDADINIYFEFFAFMQSHIMKLLDPSYINKKPRPTKYDKEILAHTALWERKELMRELRRFGKLEILCKKKSPDLKIELQRLYLQAIS